MSMRENTDSFRIEGDKKFQNEGFDAKKVYYVSHILFSQMAAGTIN